MNYLQDSPDDALVATAIQNDDLHQYENQKRKDAEYCILTAAKLVASFVEDNFSDGEYELVFALGCLNKFENAKMCVTYFPGYDWCVNAIKNSEYARLAADLEINKAVMFLKQNHLQEAVSTLKAFEKDSIIALNAAINLSFIYFLVSEY